MRERNARNARSSTSSSVLVTVPWPVNLAGIIAGQPALPGQPLCTETDPELFFPEKGESTAAAKSVCRRCDVRAECLDLALENGERYGVWGGLSERERRKLRGDAA